MVCQTRVEPDLFSHEAVPRSVSGSDRLRQSPSRRKRPSFVAVVFSFLTFVSWPAPSCAQQTPVVDSAGVTITRNATSTAYSNEEAGFAKWRVESEPALVIGMVDGPEEYLLQAPQRALLLRDGTTVIQNSLRGLFEIRYFSADGGHLATVGRWGQGPWEFHYAAGLHWLPGDSILVIGQDQRFAVFGPRGEPVREGSLGLRPQPRMLNTFLLDPEHAGVERFPFSVPKVSGQDRQRWAYSIHDLEDGTTVDLGEWQGEIVDWEHHGSSVSNFPQPFTPMVGRAGGAGVFWVGQSDRPEIQGFDANGKLRVLLQLDREPQPVTRADERRFREVMVSQVQWDPPEQLASRARTMEFPEMKPYFGFLEVDRLGNLWIQRYEPPWTEGHQYWDIYDPEGRRIAEATVPEAALGLEVRHPLFSRSNILDIGEDFLVAALRDELGVRYVAKFRIVKEN